MLYHNQSSKKKISLGAVGEKNTRPDLTDEQKQEIREAFDLFDTDESGMC